MAMLSQNTLNQLSRRKWLRDMALAATSVVVVPSVLTGCSDHPIPPALAIPPTLGVGAGMGEDLPLPNEVLKAAAQNLLSMKQWYDHLYTVYTQPYISKVYFLIKGGETEPPTNWKEIFVDIFIDIGAGILQAALAEFPGVGPAIAITAKEIEKWGLGQKAGKGVDAAIAEFVTGYDDMHDAVVQNLDSMASSGSDGNYTNLREAFKGGDIEFNGKKYSLKDLAQQRFPDPGNPDDIAQYDALTDAANLKFKRSIWNVMFIKAGSMAYADEWIVNYNGLPTQFGRDVFYKEPYNNSNYLRGLWTPFGYAFRAWYFTFDGRTLSFDAAKELFIDDTPGHIMNPDEKGKPKTGLFNRDYVFKQFHREKPSFNPGERYTTPYHDLRKDLEQGPVDDYGFDRGADNYVFKGGDFPQLTK